MFISEEMTLVYYIFSANITNDAVYTTTTGEKVGEDVSLRFSRLLASERTNRTNERARRGAIAWPRSWLGHYEAHVMHRKSIVHAMHKARNLSPRVCVGSTFFLFFFFSLSTGPRHKFRTFYFFFFLLGGKNWCFRCVNYILKKKP